MRWTLDECSRLIYLRTRTDPPSHTLAARLNTLHDLPISISRVVMDPARIQRRANHLSKSMADLNWHEIATLLHPRTALQCSSQYFALVMRAGSTDPATLYHYAERVYAKRQHSTNMHSSSKPREFHRWSAEEIQRLRSAMTQYYPALVSSSSSSTGTTTTTTTTTTGHDNNDRKHRIRINWKLIANTVETRSPAQCCLKWYRSINPAIQHGPFSPAEIRAALKAWRENGCENNWAKMAQSAGLERRTDEQIRLLFLTMNWKANALTDMDDDDQNNTIKSNQ